MYKIDPMEWRESLTVFKEAAHKFYAGELSRGEYKGISGKFGSYAQKEEGASMIRLRMTAGRVTKKKLAFVADMIEKHAVNMAHFTTCQTIQLHNLGEEAVCDIMEGTLEAGIVTLGGGGDHPRNITCSPMTGVEPDEYFDVMPYAEEAGEFLMNFVEAAKMPRKLKVGFSNSPKNVPHATFRDLGFVAREDGYFDVYSAGGLGNNPRFGVLIAEKVDPSEVLYYVKAMWYTFRAYGDYENRGKARSRYMQDVLGGPEKYREAFLEKLELVKTETEETAEGILAEKLEVKAVSYNKVGDGSSIQHARAIPQKQNGLYTVVWHPIGGQPSVKSLVALSKVLDKVEDAELRLSPDETAYIINLTGDEANAVIEATKDTAQTLFETSVSCIGASICQIGLRDSQSLLAACVKAVAEAELPDGALPQIHISGCTSSCGTHQTGAIGFRGASRKVEGSNRVGFMLYDAGCDLQGQEKMGEEIGVILVEEIPAFLVALGKTVAASGMDYAAWRAVNPDGVKKISEAYL